MSSVDLRELGLNQNQLAIQPLQKYSNSIPSPVNSNARQTGTSPLPRSWSQNDVSSLQKKFSTPTTVNEYFATIDSVPEEDEFNNGIFF